MDLHLQFGGSLPCGRQDAAINREKMIEHFHAILSKLRWLVGLAIKRRHC
jgi:hypothetical protein